MLLVRTLTGFEKRNFHILQIGPALSGFIVHAFGFRAMLYIISCLCLCYAPLLFYLRDPPAREEKAVILTIPLPITLKSASVFF